MKVKKIIIISPPFSSQLAPTLALAKAFHERGMQTIVACGEPFRERITREGLGFVQLLVNRNANTGVALRTRQPEEERRRLNAFLESTKRGAAATLTQQSKDRREDMFADPGALAAEIEEIDRQERSDLWVVNQLSYAATLVLYCLDFPFITFCPPHPLTIPQSGKIYGVPAAWPASVQPDDGELHALKKIAQGVERSFTDEFNRFLTQRCGHARPVPNAFRLTSRQAILYNYPDFEGHSESPDRPHRIYMGSCFEEETLPHEYKQLLKGSRGKSPKVLIVMGTFLSYRSDVLETCIAGVKKRFPGGLVITGAGASAETLQKLYPGDVYIEEYVPQKALTPHMDVIIHHGGNNSFTESLYYGRPMVILPFSSDQFDIAADAEKHGIAEVLNPNSMSPKILGRALDRALAKSHEGSLSRWQEHVRARGPGYAVRKLLSHETWGKLSS